MRGATASICGRRIYEIMRYWQEDRPGWGAEEHDSATAWRNQPKWVVSRSLTKVGSNATLISEDVEAVVRDLKARLDGRADICGTVMAQSLTELGLIDEYRLYFHPAVVGGGKPYFAGSRLALRLVSSERFGDQVIRLTYAPG